MKKILLLCDGDNFPKGAFKLIEQIRVNEPVTVKGLFFTSVDIEQMIPIGFIPVSEPYTKLKEGEKLLQMKSQDQFSKACEKHGIKYKIHPYEGSWDRDLFVKESRFADLVIISEELFCLDALHVQPNYFMEETLRASECPVMVVPEQFKEIERLAVAYDGGKEAMFALKQFVYLFPDYVDLPADFVHIKNESGTEIPDQALLNEYTKTHFESLNASRLHFDPKKYFSSWLENRRNVLLVTGSYARSAFSNLFNKSFADSIIANHTCPIFIAHFS
ncbi:MAG TPA: universal stress protein [Puia sp.]|nr:universal stress protein [Puia sp.]